MKKNKRVEEVKALCNNVIPYFEQSFFNRYIEDYKNYLWYTWDRAAMIEDWQTNIFFPMVWAIVDTMFSSMYDSKLKFNVTWKWLKWTDKLLNNAFDYKNTGKDALMDTIKECIITGKGYMKPIFVKHKESKIVRWQDYWHVIKRPMLKYVSVFNLFYDYNTTLSNSAFTIERYIMNRKSIVKEYANDIKWKKEWFDSVKYIDTILNNETVERFSEYDVNRVRHIIAYEKMNKKNNISTVIPSSSWSSSKEAEDTIEWRNNIYAVDFNKNKVYEVIEYNDDNWRVVIIDGKLLFVWPKPVNDTTSLITDISFNKIPWTSDATGIATNIWELQWITNSLYNIFLDNLKMQVSPMFEQVGWMNQMLGKKNKITYSPYKVIPTNTPWSLRKIDLGIGWFEPINVIQFIEQFAEKRSWVNEYIMWGQGKVERIAGWVDLIFNQYKSKLMPLTNTVNNAMWYIAKAFLLMYAINFTSDELKELWLEDELDFERFLDERNITFRLSSLSLLSEEEWIKQLTDSLGTIMPFIQWQGWPNIDTKELVKWILKKDVDMDAILNPEQPQQQWWWDIMWMINSLWGWWKPQGFKWDAGNNEDYFSKTQEHWAYNR